MPVLSRNVPDYPFVKPDIDKLARCVLDGLQGVVYDEDSRIVRLEVDKDYEEGPGVHVTVQQALPPHYPCDVERDENAGE